MNSQVFVIKSNDEVYGVAESKTQAKKQARWFLPKEKKYVADIFEVINGNAYFINCVKL